MLGPGNAFSHIIDLSMEEVEVKARAEGMRANPVDGVNYSNWEREERKKPKPVKLDEEGEPIIEEEDEDAIKPLDENELVVRANESDDKLLDEI